MNSQQSGGATSPVAAMNYNSNNSNRNSNDGMNDLQFTTSVDTSVRHHYHH